MRIDHIALFCKDLNAVDPEDLAREVTNTKKALAKNASASSFVAGRRIELRTS